MAREKETARIARPRKGKPPQTLCIDIGGTGIKAMVIDASDRPRTDRVRVDTPRPATPHAILAAIRELVRDLGPYERVSVGFPGVVRKGVTETAWNLHPKWIGVNLAKALEKILGKPVRVANDADVQGYGVVRGRGVELVVTLGTGFGSSLFVDGKLVPNIQLAHHPAWRKKTFEEELGDKELKQEGRRKWNKRLERAIRDLASLFNYDTLYLGGGNSANVRLKLPRNVRIVSNVAGLLGGIALWRD